MCWQAALLNISCKNLLYPFPSALRTSLPSPSSLLVFCRTCQLQGKTFRNAWQARRRRTDTLNCSLLLPWSSGWSQEIELTWLPSNHSDASHMCTVPSYTLKWEKIEDFIDGLLLSKNMQLVLDSMEISPSLCIPTARHFLYLQLAHDILPLVDRSRHWLDFLHGFMVASGIRVRRKNVLQASQVLAPEHRMKMSAALHLQSRSQ